MTPGARVAAAIDILDQIRGGMPAEKALTTWGRSSRYAGSKDRAAIRDHVFDVLRRRRSLGDGSGRALMIALARQDGLDLDALFSGEGHAPAPVVAGEAESGPLSDAAACDVPEWLWPAWTASLGENATAIARVQQTRAPVFLRVNTRRGGREAAIALLKDDDIVAAPHADVPTALRVLENPRRVRQARAYTEGFVELQDAASQLAVAQVPVSAGARVLDYCAGGGGKALAFADLTDTEVFAHDIAPDRMADLPGRASRAGVQVQQLSPESMAAAGPFDVVFCDAPCSGSGTWRRTPDAKWRLTEADLTSLHQTQIDVLGAAADLVAEHGILAYATCSVLATENDDVIDRFLKSRPEWQLLSRWQHLPSADGDGFFMCCLRHSASNL